MLAMDLIKYMEKNMEGVNTIAVPFHISQIKEAIVELDQLQAELAKHRWIPVSERLPENPGSLLAFGKDGYGYEIVAVTSYDHRFEKFRILSEVTHWKPIYLPPKDTKDGKEEK